LCSEPEKDSHDDGILDEEDSIDIPDQGGSSEAGQKGILDQTLGKAFGERFDCITESNFAGLALCDDEDLTAQEDLQVEGLLGLSEGDKGIHEEASAVPKEDEEQIGLTGEQHSRSLDVHLELELYFKKSRGRFSMLRFDEPPILDDNPWCNVDRENSIETGHSNLVAKYHYGWTCLDHSPAGNQSNSGPRVQKDESIMKLIVLLTALIYLSRLMQTVMKPGWYMILLTMTKGTRVMTTLCQWKASVVR
jgi:hypothetical protein